MAINTHKDEVEWNLDWDDLTGGESIPPAASVPPPTPETVPAGQPPRDSVPSAPPPSRLFPTPAATSPDAELASIVPPQRSPGAGQPTSPPPGAAVTPPPLPTASTVPTAPAAHGSISPAPAAPASVRSLVRGQRLRLAEILPDNPPPAFAVGLEVATPTGVTVDRCCFGLDEAGQLSDDRYFVFYNQTSSPEGAVGMRGAWGEIFHVDLSLLPTTVRRLVFTATIDGTGSVRRLGASRFELRGLSAAGGARYEFTGGDLDEVKALIVAEIYYKDGWRLAAVGQGFAGGLSELLRHFGGQEA